MSAALYRLKVLKCEDRAAVFQVSLLQPEAGGFYKKSSELKDFILQLITEAWYRMKEGHFFSEESYLPVSMAAARQLAEHHPEKAILEAWHQLLYPLPVEIPEEDYLQLSHDRQRRYKTVLEKKLGFKIKGWGSGDSFLVYPEGNYKAFVEVAASIVEEVSVEKPVAGKSRKQPQVHLGFSVQQAPYLAHLLPDLTWETTAFSLSAYYGYPS